MIKKKIKWNKPTYLGAAILDVSRLKIYKFHYENMVPKYGRRARVLYKYMDSLFCEVQTPDLYRDLVGFKNKLDLSDYPPNHFLFSIDNKKVPLKLSDELNGSIISEAVFLKPKAYSISYIDSESYNSKCSAKGRNYAVEKNHYITILTNQFYTMETKSENQ